MDAQRTPDGDLAAFLDGLEFGLTAIEGRLHRGETPSAAELQATVDEYRRLAERMRTRVDEDETPYVSLEQMR